MASPGPVLRPPVLLSRSAPTPIRELGKHPEDEDPINIFEGRYGPYVKHGKINATIPKGYEIEHITLERGTDFNRTFEVQED